METTPPYLAREPSQTHRLQGNNDHVSFCFNAFRDVEFPLQAAIPKFGLKSFLGHEGGAWRGRGRGRGRGGFGGDVGGGGGSRGEKDKGIAEAVPIVRLIAPVWACVRMPVTATVIVGLARTISGIGDDMGDYGCRVGGDFVSTPARSCAHLPSRCPSFLENS